jgi:hypothetical protein
MTTTTDRPDSGRSNHSPEVLEKAATKIQAVFRGHRVMFTFTRTILIDKSLFRYSLQDFFKAKIKKCLQVRTNKGKFSNGSADVYGSTERVDAPNNRKDLK